MGVELKKLSDEMPFGKFQGRLFSDLIDNETEYISWLMAEAGLEFNKEAEAYYNKVIRNKTAVNTPPSIEEKDGGSPCTEKQLNLFGEEIRPILDKTYTSKITAPIYEPKNKKPNILELVDTFKSKRLMAKIAASALPDEEKAFLMEAARRHYVFNYSKIADYYAHASKEMQELMEESALVIIDFNKAIELGYVKLSSEIAEQYIEDNKDA